MSKSSTPKHIGFIPDGNRRWALMKGLTKEAGYIHGVTPGVLLFEECKILGIKEISVFCFTQDNTKRPAIQKEAFINATIAFVDEISQRGASLLVLGDENSSLFPDELKEFRHRKGSGMKVNLLINYGWEWDLKGLKNGGLYSRDISRIDLIVRWGGRCRLSGFLPVQSVYSDIYVREECWPDYQPFHFKEALAWFKVQDRTLGG